MGGFPLNSLGHSDKEPPKRETPLAAVCNHGVARKFQPPRPRETFQSFFEPVNVSRAEIDSRLEDAFFFLSLAAMS